MSGIRPPSVRRVLGLDPGLRRTGWGVIETDGVRLRHVAHGVCATDSGELAGRLASLYDQLRAILTDHQPHTAAVEHTFVNADAVGTLKLAHARAIALLVPAQAGLAVSEYAPNAVKKAVVGVGHADKRQVEHMIQVLLPSAGAPSADAADALAVAVCHAYQDGANARLAKALERAR